MKELFQRLADNLKANESDGWVEDKDDRTVKVTENKLTIKGTFEHCADDRGGRHRVSLEFRVEDGLLLDDNGDECPLDNEETLQEFVNSRFMFSPG